MSSLFSRRGLLGSALAAPFVLRNVPAHAGFNLKPLPGTPLLSGHPLAQGLTLRWLVDDGSGRLFNAVGGSHAGILNNSPAWVLDNQRGRVLKFTSGSSTYVQSTTTMDFSKGWTMGGWFNIISWDANNRWLTGGPTNCPVFWHATGSPFKWGLVHDGSIDYQSNIGLSTGVWQHLILACDLTSVRFFVNGRSQESGTTTGFTFSSGTPQLGGNASGTFPEYTSMYADDIVFYKRALSAAEVWQLYSRPYESFAVPKRRFYFVSGGAAPPPATATPQMLLMGVR